MPEVSVLDQYFEEIAARLERRIEKHALGNVSPKRLFNVPEAAEYLGRSENAVKLLIHRGKLPVTRIDSKSQIDKKALDKLIDGPAIRPLIGILVYHGMDARRLKFVLRVLRGCATQR